MKAQKQMPVTFIVLGKNTVSSFHFVLNISARYKDLADRITLWAGTVSSCTTKWTSAKAPCSKHLKNTYTLYIAEVFYLTKFYFLAGGAFTADWTCSAIENFKEERANIGNEKNMKKIWWKGLGS